MVFIESYLLVGKSPNVCDFLVAKNTVHGLICWIDLLLYPWLTSLTGKKYLPPDPTLKVGANDRSAKELQNELYSSRKRFILIF
jgi:hypothetical protein